MAYQVESRGYMHASEGSGKPPGHPRKIYVAGLLAKTSAQECLEYFSQFGPITNIHEVNTSNSNFNRLRGPSDSPGGFSSDENQEQSQKWGQGTSKKHMLLTVRDKATHDSILATRHIFNGKPLFCAPYHTGSQLMRHNRLSNQRRVILRCQDKRNMTIGQIHSLVGPLETIFGFDPTPAVKHAEKRFGGFSVLMPNKEAAVSLVQEKTLVEPQTGTILTVEAFKSEKHKKSSQYLGTPQSLGAQAQGGELRKLTSMVKRPQSTQNIPEFSTQGRSVQFVNFRGHTESATGSLFYKPTPANLAGNFRTLEQSSLMRKTPNRLERDRQAHEYLDSLNSGGRTRKLFRRLPKLDHSGDNLRFNHLARHPPAF